MKTKSKFRYKTPLLFIATGLALVVLILVGISSYQGGSKPNFQEYKPVVLPRGITVTSSDLYVLRDYSHFVPTFIRHANLNLTLANSWIEESKSDGRSFYENWCKEYGQPDCTEYITSQNQRYLLATIAPGINQTKKYTQEIYFIKKDTSIDIIFTSYSPPQISKSEWDKVIDSFEPARLNSRVVHGSARGP